jgi:hypothetical protein
MKKFHSTLALVVLLFFCKVSISSISSGISRRVPKSRDIDEILFVGYLIKTCSSWHGKAIAWVKVLQIYLVLLLILSFFRDLKFPLQLCSVLFTSIRLSINNYYHVSIFHVKNIEQNSNFHLFSSDISVEVDDERKQSRICLQYKILKLKSSSFILITAHKHNNTISFSSNLTFPRLPRSILNHLSSTWHLKKCQELH